MSSSRRVLARYGRHASGRRSGSGFTLIELMVTLAVIGILAVVAVPGMQMLINGNRLAGATGELTSALQLARSEAIRRSARVTVCRSSNGTTCDDGTDWSQWIVIGQDNATGTDDVIRNETVAGPLQVTGPEDGIVFRPSGLIDTQAQLTVCVPTANPPENQTVITVMISGATATARANGAGACP